MSTTKTTNGPVPIFSCTDEDFEKRWAEVSTRTLRPLTATASKKLQARMHKVRRTGDRALLALLPDKCEQVPKCIEVRAAEWDRGCEAVASAERAALGKAAMRVREFHRKRIPGSWELLRESKKSRREPGRGLSYVVTVPAGESVEVGYAVVMRP